MLAESDRQISYILCTKNKLRYLQRTVPDLLKACRPEDEIVVFDGASTDGSREYLQKFYDEGKFRFFRSERDCNQAHGLNKAILNCRGEIIKIILDDDVHDYPSIRKCASLMLADPSIDVLGTNVAIATYGAECNIRLDLSKQKNFEQWSHEKGEAFWFWDQCFTFRRSSLPIVGLWHTGLNCIDREITLRLTSLRQAKLVWFTGTTAIHLLNEASLCFHPEYSSKMVKDIRRLYTFHGLAIPPEYRPHEPAPVSPLKQLANKITRGIRVRTRVANLLLGLGLDGVARKVKPPQPPPTASNPAKPADAFSYEMAYSKCRQWLDENNGVEKGTLIH